MSGSAVLKRGKEHEGKTKERENKRQAKRQEHKERKRKKQRRGFEKRREEITDTERAREDRRGGEGTEYENRCLWGKKNADTNSSVHEELSIYPLSDPSSLCSLSQKHIRGNKCTAAHIWREILSFQFFIYYKVKADLRTDCALFQRRPTWISCSQLNKRTFFSRFM